jgi:hypothetical protein
MCSAREEGGPARPARPAAVQQYTKEKEKEKKVL